MIVCLLLFFGGLCFWSVCGHFWGYCGQRTDCVLRVEWKATVRRLTALPAFACTTAWRAASASGSVVAWAPPQRLSVKSLVRRVATACAISGPVRECFCFTQ